MRCLGSRCRNSQSHDKWELSMYLCWFSFTSSYEVGASRWATTWKCLNSRSWHTCDNDKMDEMLDGIWLEFDLELEEPYTLKVKKFLKLLKASEEPWEDYEKIDKWEDNHMLFYKDHINEKSVWNMENQVLYRLWMTMVKLWQLKLHIMNFIICLSLLIKNVYLSQRKPLNTYGTTKKVYGRMNKWWFTHLIVMLGKL